MQVADDGYGVSYIIAGEDTVFFHVSSKRSCSMTVSTPPPSSIRLPQDTSFHAPPPCSTGHFISYTTTKLHYTTTGHFISYTTTMLHRTLHFIHHHYHASLYHHMGLARDVTIGFPRYKMHKMHMKAALLAWRKEKFMYVDILTVTNHYATKCLMCACRILSASAATSSVH